MFILSIYIYHFTFLLGLDFPWFVVPGLFIVVKLVLLHIGTVLSFALFFFCIYLFLGDCF